MAGDQDSVGVEHEETYKQLLSMLGKGDLVSFNKSTSHAAATGECRVMDVNSTRVGLKESEMVYYIAYIDDMELKETDVNGETRGWHDILTIELLGMEGSA